MRFRARKRIKIGPFYLNFTQRGFSSWGVKLGPFSHNFTRRTSHVDIAGPGGFHHQHRR